MMQEIGASLERVLRRFEDAWQSGLPPRIEDYATPGSSRELLVELVHIDLERRLKRGEPARVESYFDRFPELTADPSAAVELVLAEYAFRRRHDPSLAAAEILARFPQYNEALRQRLLAGNTDTAHGQETPPPQSRPSSGRGGTLPTLPGYEMLNILGQGGMGVVYKARQQSLGRLVAVKMLQPRLSQGEAVRRFLSEARTIARLQHPNIVQLYEASTHEGRPYLVMELVEGGSLASRLHGTPLPPAEAAALIATLARAVQAAHQAGVVHRDLKPGNVLLGHPPSAGSRRNEELTGPKVEGRFPLADPKITDFGLAKQLDVDEGQTQSGEILGTPSYMAPEQAMGRTKAVGPACDIYALGAMLYELLTGRPPFKGASVLDTLEQVRKQEPVSPRQLQPRLPKDLETICLKCLQKEPERRYASAQDLADDLERYQRGKPIRARPIGYVGRFWRWAQRNPGIAALSAAVFVILALAATGSAVAAVWINEARERAIDLAHREGKARARAELLAQAEARAKEQVAEEKRLVEKERDRARAWLAFASQNVKRYMEWVRRIPRDSLAIGDFANILKLQKELDAITQKFYAEFEQAGANLDQPEFYRELAGALHSLGELTQDLHTPEQAIPIFQKAIRVRQRLVDQELGNTDDLAGLWSDLNRLGIALHQQTKWHEAEQVHLRALHVGRHRHKRGDPDALYDLASTWNNLGLLYRAQGYGMEAWLAYQMALHLREHLAGNLPQDHPLRSLLRGELAQSYGNLGDFYRSTGDLARGEQFLEKCFETLAQAAKDEEFLTGHEDHRLTFAQAAQNLAIMYSQRGREDKAVDLLKRALPIFARLVQEHPRVPAYVIGLAKCQSILAIHFIKGKDTKEAEKLLFEAQATLARLPPEQEATTDLVVSTATNLQALALLYFHQGRLVQALAACEQAVVLVHRLRNLGLVQAEGMWRNLLLIRGGICMELGRYREGQRDFEVLLNVGADRLDSQLRIWRAVCMAGEGNYLDALSEVLRIFKETKRLDRFSEAKIYALASAHALKDADPDLTDTDRLRRSRRYADRAVSLLKELHEAGYFADASNLTSLRGTASLDPIRSRQDFKELLKLIEASQPPEP